MQDITSEGALSVRRDFPDTEPRIRDVELGGRLGLAIKPLRLAIRQLIDRGALGGCVEQRQGRAVVYWLDERSALLLAARTDTDDALDVTLEMIDLFVSVRRHGAHPEPEFRAVLAPDYGQFEPVWDAKTIAAICQVYGWPYEPGGRVPRPMRRIFPMIYRLMYGEAFREMQRVRMLQPNPEYHRCNHHALLTPEARNQLKREIRNVRRIAQGALKTDDPRIAFRAGVHDHFADFARHDVTAKGAAE